MRRFLAILVCLLFLLFATDGMAGRWQIVGVPIVPKTVVGTMSGNETFDNDDGTIFVKDPGGTSRNFNPSGTFPAGSLVYVINAADAGENVTFDSSGCNQTIGQNECGAFIYDGSDWRVFWLGQNDLTQDGSVVFGDIGIGTTPLNKLHIGDSLNVSGSEVLIADSNGNADIYFGQGSANYAVLRWTYNATPANSFASLLTTGYSNDIKIDGADILLQTLSSGNVGIGTTGPDRKLDVLNASNPQIRLTHTDSSKYADLQATSTGDFSITSNLGTLLKTDSSNYNLLIGQNAGQNDNGRVNTFIGYEAGYNNSNTAGTEGYNNTYIGYGAGYGATGGSNNTGHMNTAVGEDTLRDNTTGSFNTAIGYDALNNNTTGNHNNSLGLSALHSNTTGSFNTACGDGALYNSGTVSNNTALGSSALYYCTGANNIGVGYCAGLNATTGSSNIVIGYNINLPVATDSGTLNIGNLLYGRGLDGTSSTISNGNIGIRTASFGTNAVGVLAIANGTAPTSSPADSIQLYAEDVSASSELKVRDEGGNVTTLSPHDPETGEWIFYSKNTKTGKVLRVRMEAFVKFFNDKFGTDFVQEFFEPAAVNE